MSIMHLCWPLAAIIRGHLPSMYMGLVLCSLSVPAGYFNVAVRFSLQPSRCVTLPHNASPFVACSTQFVGSVCFCPVYDVVLLLLLPMSDLLVRLIVFDRLLVSRVFESPLLVLQLSFPLGR